MHPPANGLLRVAGLLRRQLSIIASTILVVLGFSAALLVIANVFYTATALIIVGNADGEVGPSSGGGAHGEPDDAWIDSEIEILRSDTLLLGVVEDLDLVSDPVFGARPQLVNRILSLVIPEALVVPEGNAAVQQTLRHIRNAITIERRGATYLIAITVRTSDPKKAALLANAIANRHIGTRAGFTAAPAHIVSSASPPGYPGIPDMPRVLVAAGLGGLVLGIAIALGSAASARIITSGEQLSTVSRTPVLGTVPRLKMPSDLASLSQFMILSPLSGYSESIRQIRTGIDLHLDTGHRPGRGGAVIMISSPVTDEGRTSIALSLARTYAASGRRTLVVDCDLRHPSIHRHLGIESENGLVEYLSGQLDSQALHSLIVLDSETGMGVVIGSRRPEAPTDQLVTGLAFRRLLQAATDNFEIVILDTPPVLPVVDGLYLARYADAIVIVVKGFSTAQADVRTAIARLEESRRPGTPLFTVLNQHDDFAIARGKTPELSQRG